MSLASLLRRALADLASLCGPKLCILLVAVVGACTDDGAVPPHTAAKKEVRLISERKVDLGEVDAIPDAIQPPIRVSFEVENLGARPVGVLDVVKSCGCLEVDSILEIPCGRSQIKIGVRPQTGRAFSHTVWLRLSAGESLTLSVCGRGRQGVQIDAGVP